MKHAYEILFSFHDRTDLSVDTMLRKLLQFVAPLQNLSPSLNDWLLGGETKEEALLYEVFKGYEPTTSAKAVLETQLKGKIDPRCIVIWNGRDGHEGASVQFIGRPKDKTSLVTLVGRPKSFSSDWHLVVDALMVGASIWSPSYITVESNGYFERKTFKDRPGVGWMLYLPKVLSASQVPEARALVPVMSADKKQTGTIIVSVTDDAFSDENPEHVKIANAIEIRLVDQDLLPRYSEL